MIASRVHLTSAGIELTARLPAPLPAIGGVLELLVPPDRVHLFDGESQDLLDDRAEAEGRPPLPTS